MNLLRNQKICLKEFILDKALFRKDGDIRIKLSKKFQNKIFSELILKFSSNTLSKVLKISRCMIHSYKNNRTNNISLDMLYKIISLLNITRKELKKNILKCYSYKERVNNIMEFGRRKRFAMLKSFRSNIPKVSNILVANQLNLEKWFFSYKKLIDFGSRKFKNIKK